MRATATSQGVVTSTITPNAVMSQTMGESGSSTEEEIIPESDDGMDGIQPGKDGSQQLSQEQILDIVANTQASNNKDALAYTARIEDQLMNKSTSSQQLSLKHAKPQREYKVKKLSSDTLEYLQRAHVAYRIAFGLYLNQDPILLIIKKVFQDFPGNADDRESAEGVAWERLRNVCSSWKLKTIKHLEDHVKLLCSQDKVLADCEDLKTLHNFLKDKFDADNWGEIMEPWRKTVNVRASGPKVRRWSKSLYVDLGARIKLSLDWKKIPASTRPAEVVWDKAAISHRFDTITRAPGYKQIRPARADITIFTPHTKKRVDKCAKREVEVVDATTDPDIFIDSEL
ncbi:hypothetical protein F4861DRAFT_540926 [Xylaria intraflava]|nr:hypothetical protein F4861DRAFT_540926 [Xylaria intraflava]